MAILLSTPTIPTAAGAYRHAVTPTGSTVCGIPWTATPLERSHPETVDCPTCRPTVTA